MSDISFNSVGTCNYCEKFIIDASPILKESSDSRRARLDGLVSSIKVAGKNNRYDCVMGLSGGVDSTWALLQAKHLGLRPLVVHVDNGWNSELAQYNMERALNALDFDLHTVVIEWQEYRELMLSFFDAGVIDIELLYDNSIVASLYECAKVNGIKYILTGGNTATEGFPMPSSWYWFKLDRKNIYSIAKRHGVQAIKSLPTISVNDYIVYSYLRRIKAVPFLNYFDFNKSVALDELEVSLGFKRYPYKHYESQFTRFYQGYILPEKFGVDKRMVHLSNLVMTGELSRAEGLKILSQSPYSSPQDLAADKSFFLKKIRWNESEFDDYLGRPGRGHLEYGSEKLYWDFLFDRIGSYIPSWIKKRLRLN